MSARRLTCSDFFFASDALDWAASLPSLPKVIALIKWSSRYGRMDG